MILTGDLMAKLPTLEANSFDACFCDPPYGLSFMGKAWDHGVPGPEVWAAILRVLKPGAPLMAFGGTRTYHRLACAIEDGGFAISDTLCWLHGQGFPKGHAQLKPAWEPITLAWKKGARVLAIDAARIGTTREVPASPSRSSTGIGMVGLKPGLAPSLFDTQIGRWPANVLLDEYQDQIRYLRDTLSTATASLIREYFDGYCGLQNLQQHVDGGTEQRRAGQVLQPNLLRGGAQPEKGNAVSTFRQATHARNSTADRGDQGGTGLHGSEKQFMEGWAASNAGLSDGDSKGSLASGSRSRGTDVTDRARIYSRASANDGSVVRASTGQIGSGSPSQRGEDRQSDRKPGTPGVAHSQDAALANRLGTESPSSRKRTAKGSTLEVLESDIPQAWLKYFASTGRYVRAGAAAALDAQSGESASKAGLRGIQGRHDAGDPETERRKEYSNGVRGHSDSGGASRFFYCAKASRSERGEGNTHPTVKPLKLTEYLARIILPPERDTPRRLLVPFAGSMSEVMGGILAGWDEITAIEKEPEYCRIGKKRIAGLLSTLQRCGKSGKVTSGLKEHSRGRSLAGKDAAA